MLKLMKTSLSACPRGDAPPERDASWHWRGRLSALSLVFIAFLAGSTVAMSQLEGDLDGNYRVDFKDLRTLARQWLNPICLVSGCIADLDGADGVNMADFALLAKNWQIEEPHLVISELMASNASSPPLEDGELLDGNGESSDWIEVYNPMDIPVSLDGWYLTDSDANLTLWQFPDGLQIKAGEFLIIFASGKTYEQNPLNYPYLDSLGYYHTNFELNQTGDYLALVAADGNTVIHEYAAEFPVQLTDISYGLAQYATAIVPTSAIASYHVPTSSDAGTDWTAPNFDDLGWGTQPTTNLNFGDICGIKGLNYKYFEGYWWNVPVDDFDHTEPISEGIVDNFDITPHQREDSFGFRFTGFIEVPLNGDYTFYTTSDDGSLLVINDFLVVDNDGRHSVQERSGIIYLDAGVHFIKVDYFEHNVDEVLIVSYEGPGISKRTIPDDVLCLGTVANEIQSQMQYSNASLWTRIEFEVEDPDFYDMLMLRMKYEDGFVAYLNGVEVAHCNSPNPVQWDSTADSDRPIEESWVFKNINIMPHLGLLLPKPQKNVLAIHGLNDHENDGEFLILPELVIAKHQKVPQYFTTVTPGSFNVLGAKGVVEEVWFSHKRGFYDTPFQLMLSNGTDGAEICYTDDGSRPTITHGTPYTGPFDVNETATIRAVAVKPGWLDSDVETHTYIFLDNVINQSPNGEVPPGWPPSGINGQVLNYGMDPDIVNNGTWGPQLRGALTSIPTISLVTDLANLFDPTIGIYVNAYQDGLEWERPTSVELLNPDGSEGFHINAGLRIRGGFSRQDANPKHALRLLFRNEYGAGKLRYPLFDSEGVDEFDKIDLRTSQNYSWAFEGSSQNTLIREVFSRDVQRDMGQPYTRSRYYHLYINGHYWGLYQTQERADADFAESYLGGDKEEYDVIKNDSSGSRALHATDGTMDAYQRLYDAAVAGFTSDADYLAVQGLQPDGTPDPSGERLLDPENVMDYMICTYYTGDPDAPVSCWSHFSNNVFAIYNRVRPQGFTWYRHDAEHSLGANDDDGGITEGRLLTNPTDRTIGQEWIHFNPAWLHLRLTANPEYLMQFADRVNKYFLNGGLLAAAPNIQRWMTRADQIDLAIIAESARWGDSKTYLPLTKNDWEGQNNYMVNTYFPGRTQIVINQMRSVNMFPDLDAPVFNINGSYQHGGQVSAGDELTMDNPPSEPIYYTIDGSDPRDPLTGYPVGTLYLPANPVTLNKTTHVKARVLDGSTWSALNEAIFAIGPVANYLRITEIMYHPRFTGNLNDPNEEYIELKNIGQDTLNLSLVRFTEGINFTFPDMELDPNEFVVVVKDQSAFVAQYGPAVNMAGQYTGSLANDGERIKLVDAIGRTILDFEYEDGWQNITDGDGFSLTMVDAGGGDMYGSDEGLVAHWKFDDGSGSLAIDSVGTNNGTLYGDPAWTTGWIDGALSFDGDGDYFKAAAITALAGDSLTAQAWIRVDEFAEPWNPVLMQRDSNSSGYYFYVVSDNPSFFVVKGVNIVQAISPETINADQWYHVAGTNDGSNLKLYVNGRLKDSVCSTGFTGVSDIVRIGCEPLTPLYYMGLIDDVRIYNRPVSESEFQNIADPMGRWNRKSSWRASVYRNGSPGWDDSGILPNPGAVVINEVMSHSNAGPDWIELYNTTDEAINIGGWFLSDNDRDEPNLMKYRIPDGKTIEPNDYLVFYEDTDFNKPVDPCCLIPFALSENGDEACLSSPLDPNGMLTGYREVEGFGASRTNVSLGRYYKSSTGNFNFVAMDYNTPDTNNANPRVGPIVITEIMYNPPTGNQKEEYIELHNITGAAATLYRTDKLAPWKFTDGIDYTFSDSSPFVTIPANGYLMVVKDLAAFISRYGSMPLGVQVFDDYDGRLSNAGERLQIGMPGDIDEFGTRYYIRIDRVTYSDGSHPEDCPGGVDLWPTEADGLGKSLSRRDPNDYGNDVINWEAAAPSPGIANP